LLGLELESRGHNPPESGPALSHNLDDAREEIEDLVLDIQALSRRLRASELEYVGLAAAAPRYCREFSAQKNIEIDFASDGTP
jgi:signal transduction histidine kinase